MRIRKEQEKSLTDKVFIIVKAIPKGMVASFDEIYYFFESQKKLDVNLVRHHQRPAQRYDDCFSNFPFFIHCIVL